MELAGKIAVLKQRIVDQETKAAARKDEITAHRLAGRNTLADSLENSLVIVQATTIVMRDRLQMMEEAESGAKTS